MKPAYLDTRDRGTPTIKSFGEAVIMRLEMMERRLAEMSEKPPPSPLTAERALLTRLDARAGDAVTLEEQRIRDRALDEEYFKRELSVANVFYQSTAADAVNGGAMVMQLPATAAGTNPMVHHMVLARDLWPRTRPRLTIWYTSPGASTAAFNLRFQLVHFPAGLTTAVAAVFSTVFQPAGPAVANTILQASVVGGAIVPALAAPLRLSLVRLGGDANANALDVLLAVVTFEETA